MNTEDFVNPPGEIVGIEAEGDMAYVPGPLPDLKELNLSPQLFVNATEAERNLGNLSGLGRDLENPKLLLTPYLFRESLSSTRIEGTQTSLEEVLKADAMEIASSRDVKEVMNYRETVKWGLERIEREGLSLDLVKRLHEKLFEGMDDVQGPVGRFRDSQNYVGPRYTPPPPEKVDYLMENLIDYMRSEDSDAPDLVKLALSHYQFEAIHPFGDGNGRIGRILIILYLDEKEILEEPLLYLSDFFQSNRGRYFDRLFNVSAGSEFEEWINFFLRGIIKQSEDAIKRSRELRKLSEKYRDRMRKKTNKANRIEAVQYIFENPYITKPMLEQKISVSYPTAATIIDEMEEAGILEYEGGERPKNYVCREIMETITSNRETEVDVNIHF